MRMHHENIEKAKKCKAIVEENKHKLHPHEHARLMNYYDGYINQQHTALEKKRARYKRIERFLWILLIALLLGALAVYVFFIM